MQIDGTYTLQAPVERVWNCLKDQQTIQQALPGLERLTRVDDQTYAFSIQIRHAPLRGTYTGKASILEPDLSTACHFNIEGTGSSNTFDCECFLRLNAQGENTVVSYQGAFQLSRGKTLVPPALVKATIKVLLQHFFTSLTDLLRTERTEPIYVATLEETYEMSLMEEQTGEQAWLMHEEQPSTPMHRLVRRLGLGQQVPELEERWVQRLRRAGFVATLLLLVWVGTRLPRRQTGEAPQATCDVEMTHTIHS